MEGNSFFTKSKGLNSSGKFPRFQIGKYYRIRNKKK